MGCCVLDVLKLDVGLCCGGTRSFASAQDDKRRGHGATRPGRGERDPSLSLRMTRKGDVQDDKRGAVQGDKREAISR